MGWKDRLLETRKAPEPEPSLRSTTETFEMAEAARRRLAKLPTSAILDWFDTTLGDTIRAFSGYRSGSVPWDEVRLGLDTLEAMASEIESRSFGR